MKPATPAEQAALDWMDSTGAGYRRAAKEHRVSRKRLEALRARARPPAPARVRATPQGDQDELLGTDVETPGEVDDEGVPWEAEPVEFLAAQLKALDEVDARTGNELANMMKTKLDVFQRLQAAKAMRAGVEELKEVGEMFDRILVGLGEGLGLLTAAQRKRLIELAATAERLAG